jgi:phytoene dehydrogenase-like protein
MNADNEYDLIIIGAGINGLSAGIAYALNTQGKKVLIIEKNTVSGGYVTTFARSGFLFDTCQMSSNISDILEYLGIEIDFHEFTQDFVRVFKVDPETDKVKTFELFSGEGDFEEQFIKLFPDEAEKLKRFFDYSLAMFREIYGLKYAPGFLDILKMLFTCPKVIRNKDKTFSKYMEIFDIDNPEINLLFQVFSSMCGLPNDKIAALLTVGVIYSLREKAYRPLKAFIELPQKMQKRFKQLGGEILLNSEADKIIIDNGEVQGVRLKDGSVFRSKNIISTIDVKAAIEKLVGIDTLNSLNSGYVNRINSIKMTTSSFNVHLGIDNAGILANSRIDCGYALLTSGNDAFRKLYDAFENGESGLSEDCFYIGFSCPPLPENKKTLTIQTIPVSTGNWIQLREADRQKYIAEKERVADILIDITEKYLVPQLRQHIAAIDISTPATFARYSGSPTGSIYDMAAVPDNFGANRLPVKTPVRGLFLPKFAHGLFGAMNSGLQVIDILLQGRVMHGNSRFKKT